MQRPALRLRCVMRWATSALCRRSSASAIEIVVVTEAVTQAFAKTKTQIERIRFEGCWVGESPRVLRVRSQFVAAGP